MSSEELSTMISSLSELHTSLQKLRNVPPSLRKAGFPYTTISIRDDFQNLKDLAESIRSEPIQEALLNAANSEKADSSDLSRNGRRDIRKRRRLPSPESPQPFIPLEKRGGSLFPHTHDDPPALRADELVDFIRECNRTRPCKMHIWSRTQNSTGQISDPVIVRLIIQDVLVSYITATHSGSGSVLVAESVSAFGPREKTHPHSQSKYAVYQHVTQQIARMLQSQPRVSFQSLISLLCEYRTLFISQCTNCERVLSPEGHFPPVVRIWMEPEKEQDTGRWAPRHISCPQS
ncbi:unnamed protein product [Mycena citricolor]|uniref:Mediator complex subunit 27 n=1 Tax=Mycena citricolor TaxID=2018698 RepID=A0AAD2HVB2_9AGAR|nr:unnamed protein product [Mycena citricolor]